jgi:Family of unknown function (DUF6481)
MFGRYTMPKTVAGHFPPYLQTVRYGPAQTPQSVMNENDKTGFAERLKSAAEAKKALLEKMKPKAAVIDPLFAERAALRAKEKADELTAVRNARAEARAAAKALADEIAEAQRLEAEAMAEAELGAKRGARKERKALTKAEAKAARDARYAARKARK